MKKRTRILARIKYIVIGLVVLCLSVVAVTYARGYTITAIKDTFFKVIQPAAKGVEAVGDWISDRRAHASQVSDLLAQIESLEEENNSLQASVQEQTDNRYELLRLRELLEMKNTYTDYEMVGANVIAKNGTNWFKTFTIDKGSNDGIATDMNVINGDGLLGIVTEVGSDYAIVTSIINDSMNVAAVSQKTRDECYVGGDLSLLDEGYLRLFYIQENAEISEYDAIVTSNISSKYLPGLLIGYATQLETDANNLTQSGYLIPAADFSHIDEVLVITTLKSTGSN